MQVNIKQAIRLFFSNPSLDMVFIEAIANSLDADASKISICISIDELGKQETLENNSSRQWSRIYPRTLWEIL